MQKTKSSDSVKVSNSIKTRLMCIMVSLVIIPLVIAIVISYNSATNKSKNDALDLLHANTNFIKSEFEAAINNNLAVIETVTTAPSTIAFLKTYNTDSPIISVETIQKQLDSIDAIINDGNACILTGLDGNQIARTDGGKLSNVADREYFTTCVSTKKYAFSDVMVSKGTGSRISVIIVPVLDDVTGAVVGTIQRNIDLNYFHDILADKIEMGVIVDTKGIVAADAAQELTAEDEEIDRSNAEFMKLSSSSGQFESYESIPGQKSGKAYISWARSEITGWTVVVVAKDSDIMAEAVKSSIIIVIVGVFLIIICVIISLLSANGFVKPIVDINKSVSTLADGRFEVIENYSGKKDEIGLIVRNFNSVINKLDDIVRKIKESSKTVTDSSENLADMATQISGATDSVAYAVQDIATGAIQQAEEIQAAAENVNRITEAVNGVKDAAKSVSNVTVQMKKASEISSKSLRFLYDTSTSMTGKIDEIGKTISATKDAVANINERVDGIADIATQTNLLSLNASIEAARAGEAGKGFAVVAEEIRKLADDSNTLAQSIRVEMDVLLSQSEAAVNAANEVKAGNVEQESAIQETLESVNGMLEDISTTVDGVKDITEDAEVCVNSNNEVSESMTSLSAISEENASSAETTGASVEELSATVSDLAKSANDLKDVAEQLNDDISFFK